nr:retrotransposon protein, putative, Ty1-copia subclass [Tanacetum cinerariifolium]
MGAKGFASVAIIDRQIPFEYTIASRSTDLMVMALPTQNIKHSDFMSMFKREKVYVYDAYNEVAYLTLKSMTPELHRQFKNSSHYEMLHDLKSMFKKQAGVEWFDLIKTFHTCKQEEGKSVSSYVLKMKGYVEQPERLGYVLPQKIIAATPQVMTIEGGRIQKSNKKSQNAKGKGKGKGKGKDKPVCIPKPKNPKPSAKEYQTKDDACHHCKEVGHWKKNYHVYLAELMKKKKQVGTTSSLGERKMKQEAVYLYVGNGVHAQVEAIRSFDLVLPNGLMICLDNFHYAPSITRGVVSVSRLVDNGFIQCFADYGILVSKNNVLYFNVIPRGGIYEIDMLNLVPNVNSIYNVSNKIAKHNLDSTYLPHRMEMVINFLGLIHTDVCGPLRHVSRQEVEEHSLGDLNEPANCKDALLDPKSNKWLDAMNAEMQSMKDNQVLCLVDLPPNGKTIRSKWLFKKKIDMDGNVHTYQSRLVAKGYTQTYEIDYEETFLPVADIGAIRILIAIAAFYDYEIWQMDVKNAFLAGYLDEDIYTVQPKGFVDPKHPRKPGELHWTVVKNVLKYLRNTKDVFLVYGGSPKAELRVTCYCDAGFKTDRDDIKSQTGYVFVLNGGVVDWKRSK